MTRAFAVFLLISVGPLSFTQSLEKRVTPVATASAEQFSRSQTVGLAILVGVGKYPRYSGLGELHYPAADVDALAAILKQQRYMTIPLKDSDATKVSILNAIQQANEVISDQDLNLVFFFSGHGFAVDGENYLATLDADIHHLATSGLSVKAVEEALAATKASRRMLWIDACRDDAGSKGVADPRSFVNLQASAGTRLLLSTKAGKVSYEDEQLKQGIFSYYLTKGLQGEAAGPDGLITFEDLATYVTLKVRSRSLEMGRTQIPYQAGEASGDFLVGGKVTNTAATEQALYAAALASHDPDQMEAAAAKITNPALATNLRNVAALKREAARTPAPASPLTPPPQKNLGISEVVKQADDLYNSKNFAQAMPLYRQASTSDPHAMFRLGYLYSEGLGGLPQDPKQAALCFEKAALAGNIGAMYDLGHLYAEGNGVKQDSQQMISWYEKSAAGGHVRAMFALGFEYQYGRHVPQNYALAANWYQKAVDMHHIGATCNLGVLYENGLGLTQDYKKAMDLFLMAAQAGAAPCMNNVGWLYEKGRGVPVNRKLAIEWYQKAAAKGVQEAKDGLKRLGANEP